jgi:acetyltransferase-like isoleucine patch superfamily enzyme
MKNSPRGNWRQWVKNNPNLLAKVLRTSFFAFRNLQFPLIRPIHSALYFLHKLITLFFTNLVRILYWTPLFRSRIKNNPKNLFLFTGLPLLLGNLDIRVGNNCRISGKTTFSGRTATLQTPQLVIGSNVDIGWQTSISVGRLVRIGDNVRIAGRAFLAGYPGHPVDPVARAHGLPDLEEQVGDIVLEDNVWLAIGTIVIAGVTIGQNTIVAAGSVVTRDLPPNVLAGGAPARIIRALPNRKKV